MNGSKIFPLTIAATGTGSVYFSTEAAETVAVQLVKLTGSITTAFINIYTSNFGNDGGKPSENGPPLTSSLYSAYWSGPDTSFSGTLLTSSAAPGSQMYHIGNHGAKHMKVEIGSVSGATAGNLWVAIKTKS